MSDFYNRILNLRIDKEQAAFADRTPRDISAYKAGYREAQYAAAEIALEADRRLAAAAEKIAQAEALFAAFIAESDARAQAAFAAWEKQVAQLNAKIRALMEQVAELKSVLARQTEDKSTLQAQVRAAEARFKAAEKMAAALAVFADCFDGDLGAVGGGTAVSPAFKVQDFKDAKAALAAWTAELEGGETNPEKS